ncbi:BTAD domain-containing putative transcriptional regulator [Actinosynnema sp. NPDC023587]|uniref:AfsR/SARP family transcriptional regulator n=1 Tax=Actinosynnema sp. NPDC023587 TaxID=3154695 RepID=UPI0033DF336B
MLEFCLLGPVQVRSADRVLDIGHARQRSVLAALAVDVNAPVTADQLLDRVWGHQPPQTARGTLSTYLTRLRQALPPDEASIVRRAGGYALTTESAAIDLVRFRDLLERARDSDDDTAAALFTEGLGLWRDDPLRDLETPWAVGVRHVLHHQRHAAEADLVDVQLRRGRHAGVLGELLDRAADHPLDERVAGQLILALYRDGRAADALAHYDRFRARLADELGTDPAPPLRALHEAVLNADATVLAPSPASRTASRPRQLPPPPLAFTGRAREVAGLTERLAAAGPTVVISAIGGSGGIGKTWLALHWAHQHAHRFPDGQLYANLRGFDPSSAPLAPTAALRGFLAALGVTEQEIPPDVQAQAGLYRSLVADRRLLVLLDNAADSAQVADLLPSGPTCTTLITTRQPLTGLVTAHGAHPVTLDVLDDAEARELLRRRLGEDRLAAEPEAAAELVRHCAGLPLALSIVAAHAAVTPTSSLARLATDLRDQAGALDVLDTGDAGLNLRAVFSVSYRALSPDAARLAELIALAPGPDLSFAAARALSPDRTAALLRELVNAHLVGESVPGRYRMHDLVRLDAAERGRAALSEDERAAALSTLIDYYVTNAFRRDRVLDPHRVPIAVDVPEDDSVDNASVVAWFEAEHPCLVATQLAAAASGRHRDVVHIAWTMTSFHRRRGHMHALVLLWQQAVEAAALLGDTATLAESHRHLGDAYRNTDREGLGIKHLHIALAMAEADGDVEGQVVANRGLAVAHAEIGDHRTALDHALRTLELVRYVDHPGWQADAHNTVGWYHSQLGQFDQARAQCEAALARSREIHDQDTEGNSLDSLGYIAHRTGDHARAAEYYTLALEIWREKSFTYEEAELLERLGEARFDAGARDLAVEAWERALSMYRDQGRGSEAQRLEERLVVEDRPPAR